jgi:thymidylate kinase
MAEPLTPPMLVEFVGLPGAGKTTVFHQVVAQLRAEGIAIVPRDEILQQWRNIAWFQRVLRLVPETQNHWSILLQSQRLALQVKPLTRQSFLKAGKIFSNLKRIDAIAGDRRCPLILLDQGLLQEIWSVGITGSPPAIEHLQQMLALLFYQRSMAVVHFEIDIETALCRLQNRPTESSRFDLMQPEVAHSLLSTYTPYLQEILNCTRSLNIPVLQIDGSLSVKEKAEKVANWITSLIADQAITL